MFCYKGATSYSIVLFIAMIFAAAPAGYIGGIASTIQKRFQITSAELGFLSIINDVTTLTTVLFITHYGHNRHRGRVVGTLFAMASVAGIFGIIPHFFYGVPESLKTTSLDASNGTSDAVCPMVIDCEDEKHNSLRYQTVWLGIASAVSSMSSSVIPLSMPYIDDGVGKRATPIYAAFIFAAFSIGGVYGYWLSAICLSIPAYVFHIGQDGYPSPTQGDPNYLGAWWLGYVINFIFIWIMIPQFFLFPKHLKKTQTKLEEDAEKENKLKDKIIESEKTADESTTLMESVSHFFKTMMHALKRIICNVTVVLLTLLGALKLSTYAGQQLFGAKYLEIQFNLNVAFSSILFGILLIPSGICGNLVGGLFVNRYGKTTYRISLIMLMFTVLSFLIDPATLFLGCNTKDIAGITIPYPIFNTNGDSPISLVNDCNKDCNCTIDFEPVVGSDGTRYLTPCHAGCTGAVSMRDPKTDKTFTEYQNCACIQETNGNSNARKKKDTKPCPTWVWYFLLGLFSSAIITMVAVPGFMLGLRVVDERDRSMTISFANLVGKIFGSIPGPIIYGAFLDLPCLLFLKSPCDGSTGNCLIYDNAPLRLSYHGLTLGYHFVILILLLAVVFTLWEKQKRQDPEQQIALKGGMKGENEMNGYNNPALET